LGKTSPAKIPELAGDVSLCAFLNARREAKSD
jgi:hypothetical protein